MARSFSFSLNPLASHSVNKPHCSSVGCSPPKCRQINRYAHSPGGSSIAISAISRIHLLVSISCAAARLSNSLNLSSIQFSSLHIHYDLGGGVQSIGQGFFYEKTFGSYAEEAMMMAASTDIKSRSSFRAIDMCRFTVAGEMFSRSAISL